MLVAVVLVLANPKAVERVLIAPVKLLTEAAASFAFVSRENDPATELEFKIKSTAVRVPNDWLNLEKVKLPTIGLAVLGLSVSVRLAV